MPTAVCPAATGLLTTADAATTAPSLISMFPSRARARAPRRATRASAPRRRGSDPCRSERRRASTAPRALRPGARPRPQRPPHRAVTYKAGGGRCDRWRGTPRTAARTPSFATVNSQVTQARDAMDIQLILQPIRGFWPMKPQSLPERVSSLVPDPTDQIAGRVDSGCAGSRVL